MGTGRAPARLDIWQRLAPAAADQLADSQESFCIRREWQHACTHLVSANGYLRAAAVPPTLTRTPSAAVVARIGTQA